MRILLTGAHGFIGHHLSRHLTAAGHVVYGLGRSSQTQGKLADWITEWISCDLAQSPPELGDLQPEVVIHLAGRAHVLNEKAQDPLKAFRQVNVDGTRNLLAALPDSVSHFVFLSSVAVHGQISQPTFGEKSPLNPGTPYGQSKLEAEELIRNSRLPYTILRPPMVYGPGAPANFALLLKLIRKKIPFPFFQIENRRSFLYSENLCDFVLHCLNSAQAKNETFLVADERALSTPQLISLMSSALDVSSTIFPVPLPLLSFAARIIGRQDLFTKLTANCELDTSHAHHKLNWTPPWTIEQGLHQTLLEDSSS